MRETKEERNNRYAEAVWASRDEAVRNSFEYTIRFSLAALKGPVLINSAAVAALLGFMSANAKALQGHEAVIKSCFWLFAIGLFLSSVSAASAYFGQFLYTKADNEFDKTIEHPYIIERSSKYFYNKYAMVLHGLTVVLVVSGYVLFLYGVYKFISLVEIVL